MKLMSRTFEAQAHRPGFLGPCNHVAHSQTDGRDACDLFASVTAYLILIFPVLKSICIIVSSLMWGFHHFFCLVCDVRSIPECEASVFYLSWNNFISNARTASYSWGSLWKCPWKCYKNSYRVFPLICSSCFQTAIINITIIVKGLLSVVSFIWNNI